MKIVYNRSIKFNSATFIVQFIVVILSRNLKKSDFRHDILWQTQREALQSCFAKQAKRAPPFAAE